MNRKKINLVNILTTFIFLIISIEIGNGNLAVRITKIGQNLDRALSEVMTKNQPQYTNYTDNATYISDVSFHPYGMAGLYNITIKFMDFIVPVDIYPEGVIEIDKNNQFVLGEFNDWKSLVIKYAGILVMILILLLLIVFMPFCGLCFCCCRCCGKCGARSQPFDKKHDLCKKIVLATLLIGLGTLLLFGVVCAFVSNEQMKNGVDNLTNNVRDNIQDLDTFMESTKGQVNTLLGKNYEEFESTLETTIHSSSKIVYEQLVEYSNATSMTELANAVEQLPGIQEGFVTLKYSTNSLRVYASQLNDAIRKVKKDLLVILHNCDEEPCKNIKKNISTLQTNIHFNSYVDRYFPKLPDINDQISDFDKLPQDQLQNAVKGGREKLNGIDENIESTVNRTMEDALVQIHSAGEQIATGRRNITDLIDKFKKVYNIRNELNTADDYIKQYDPYRYWVAWGVSLTLLIISICVALGLICGICGKRPDVYGDDCCNKGAGSQFLICGVMLMFLSGFIMSILILAMFLVGIASQRLVCDPLVEPNNTQVFDIIGKWNLSKNFDIDLSLDQALLKCYKNESLYEVFQLEKKFNLTDVKNYMKDFKIDEILDNLNLDSIELGGEILSDTDKKLLSSLATDSTFYNVNFDYFKEILENNFTTINLKDLSKEIEKAINEIRTQELKSELAIIQMNIDTYQERIVEPMIKNATNVVQLATKLEDDLKLGKSSFREAILSLLEEIEETETTLSSDGKTILKNIARNFTNGIEEQIQNYLDRVVLVTQYDIGKCGPLSLVINSTLTSTCKKILLPWNGFWFGLFWSVLIFIPTIIISVKLATLYQKFSPYSGALVEAEYLYDAYAERDSIPLNSSNPRHGKKKKKNKKYSDYEDRPMPAGSGERGREYRSAANPQEARYADMAPKRWEDFPAGGPPQYQPAPTEYERPPPYYYPAVAADQNP